MVKVSGQRKKVVIVGGGITGLSAAYKMQQIAREQGYLLDLVLIEGKSQLGGKIQTVKRDGFVIERGPDSFLIRKKSMTELAKAVGVGDELVKNATGQAYIWLNQELYPIPAGSVMGIPTQLRPFMRTGLFSVVGKLRAMGDLVLPKTKSEGDQSLGHFFKRRLGNEVVENLIEPLLSGVYAGDIDQMSLQSTYPQFSVVEKNHRSLIKGMRKTATNQAPGRNGANVNPDMGAYSMWCKVGRPRNMQLLGTGYYIVEGSNSKLNLRVWDEGNSEEQQAFLRGAYKRIGESGKEVVS